MDDIRYDQYGGGVNYPMMGKSWFLCVVMV